MSINWYFVGGIFLGIWTAWICDNQAFKRYKAEIKELKEKLRRWELTQ